MDRDTIEYSGETYKSISRYWDMKAPDDFSSQLISYDDAELKARFYNNDKNNEFIYIENDERLYHNVKSSLPDNKDIEYLSIEFINKEKWLDIKDREVINDFIQIISQTPYSDVEIKNNIASVIIYYKNSPVCYFYGNIIADNQGEKWIALNDSESYIKLAPHLNFLSEVGVR